MTDAAGRGAPRRRPAAAFALGVAAALAAAVAFAVPHAAPAQQPADTARRTPPAGQAPRPEDEGFLARVGLDRLRLSGVGVAVGAVRPAQMEAVQAFGVETDYGEFVPRWRVVFSATFWGSHLNDATMRRYRDQLRGVVDDPAGDDTLDVGRVSVSDIALGVDARWSPRRTRSTFLRPYAGGGLSAHVLNAEGRAIDNTFVERALDNIAVGPALLAGVDAVFFRHVTLGMQARYDLVNAARHASVRALGTYLFDRAPARPRAAGAPGGGR